MGSKKGSVSSHALLQKHVDECLGLVEKADKLLGGSVSTMSLEEKQKSPRFRPIAANVIPALIKLGKKFKVVVPDRPLDDMTEQLLVASTLSPLRDELRALLAKVEDTMLRETSETWITATTVYTTLRRFSRRNAELAKALAPIAGLFAKTGRSAKTTPAPADSSAPAAPAKGANGSASTIHA